MTSLDAARGGPTRPAPFPTSGSGEENRADAFVAALLSWCGAATRRDLPWRASRDPWAVLVSEVMLQQTQAARVAPVFVRFLERFPRPATLAAAGPGEAVRWWAGLGYNRRAVRLHTAAERIVADHGGRVPDRLDALVSLPGVGPYTARAVLVFAYEQAWGVVDTNAARVLARAVAGRALGGAEVQRLADGLVPSAQAWHHNQAMLDLGALVCRRRAPRCGECPVAPSCRWRAGGLREPDPAAATAHASATQSRFEGSDRQGRGRLVAALRRGPIAHADLASSAGWPNDPGRAWRIAAALVGEGLAVDKGGALALPDSSP